MQLIKLVMLRCALLSDSLWKKWIMLAALQILETNCSPDLPNEEFLFYMTGDYFVKKNFNEELNLNSNSPNLYAQSNTIVNENEKLTSENDFMKTSQNVTNDLNCNYDHLDKNLVNKSKSKKINLDFYRKYRKPHNIKNENYADLPFKEDLKENENTGTDTSEDFFTATEEDDMKDITDSNNKIDLSKLDSMNKIPPNFQLSYTNNLNKPSTCNQSVQTCSSVELNDNSTNTNISGINTLLEIGLPTNSTEKNINVKVESSLETEIPNEIKWNLIEISDLSSMIYGRKKRLPKIKKHPPRITEKLPLFHGRPLIRKNPDKQPAIIPLEPVDKMLFQEYCFTDPRLLVYDAD